MTKRVCGVPSGGHAVGVERSLVAARTGEVPQVGGALAVPATALPQQGHQAASLPGHI